MAVRGGEEGAFLHEQEGRPGDLGDLPGLAGGHGPPRAGRGVGGGRGEEGGCGGRRTDRERARTRERMDGMGNSLAPQDC
ncbi:hypothetical protein [Streptomyces sp. NPDC047043]|uniref:hypothetical protein n=1 Tax=Streptomyces sp. NPDC047043 TaxID=3154497 RepID=UPI0033D6A093